VALGWGVQDGEGKPGWDMWQLSLGSQQMAGVPGPQGRAQIAGRSWSIMKTPVIFKARTGEVPAGTNGQREETPKVSPGHPVFQGRGEQRAPAQKSWKEQPGRPGKAQEKEGLEELGSNYLIKSSHPCVSFRLF
jgi:hypothetical protein